MNDYETPVAKKQTRIFGLTIPQIALLSGLIVIQGVILVVALKYIVFAPKDKNPVVIPTEISLASISSPVPSPTLPPTPAPDFSTAVLTIDDLPAGFAPAPNDTTDTDFNVQFGTVTFRPINRFTMVELEKEQYVLGWTFEFASTANREAFDQFIMKPDPMFDTKNKFWEGVTSINRLPLEKSGPIGELSSGWSVSGKTETTDIHLDMMLFSHKNFGGIVMVIYGDKPPVLGAREIAEKLDNRILDVLVNGPVPTPVVVSYEKLMGVKLTLADMPGGFQAIPDSDLSINEDTYSQIEEGGMRIANMFGFTNNKKNAEEFVLGYTFLFSDTLGQAVMDSLLARDEMLDAMFERTPTQKRTPITLNQAIGDRALATAIMESTDSGGVRADVLVFRRGHVGAVLVHIYIPGRRVDTVENMAVKLDKKIQELTSP